MSRPFKRTLFKCKVWHCSEMWYRLWERLKEPWKQEQSSCGVCRAPGREVCTLPLPPPRLQGMENYDTNVCCWLIDFSHPKRKDTAEGWANASWIFKSSERQQQQQWEHACPKGETSWEASEHSAAFTRKPLLAAAGGSLEVDKLFLWELKWSS